MADAITAQALFNPRAVALIGASADPTKNNARVQRLLQRAEFPGRIVPINPGRSEVLGLPAFPDVRAAPVGPRQWVLTAEGLPTLYGARAARRPR